MVKRLNNRGYVLVEIILASVIAFGIAYYMLDLTIKLKNKNDDLLAETLVMTDQAIIQNKLIEYMNSDGYSFDCSRININDNVITYVASDGEEYNIDIVNKYTTIDVESFLCNKDDSNMVNIVLPLKVDQTGKNFDLRLNYVLREKVFMPSLGDYVIYNPTVTSYMIDSTITGYTSNQTIYPNINLQETSGPLVGNTLWRVINTNSNGSVEIVSHRATNTEIYFQGQTGYQNFIYGLNLLAGAYETIGITVGHRHFGYNGQIERIFDTSKFTSTAPWTCSTESSCSPSPNDYENQGGGDTGLADENRSYIIAYKQDNSLATYWIASRYYKYTSSTNYGWYGRYWLGSTDYYLPFYLYNSGGLVARVGARALRPIVTLKSGLTWNGDGTASNPWVVS